MKKLTKVLKAFALTLSLGALAGCTGLLNGTVEVNDSNATNRLTINLAGDYVASRTIMPTAFTYGSFIYKLSGTSSTGLNAIDNPTVDANGKATVNLAPAIWNLTLEAYASTDTDYKTCLMSGTTQVDLTNGGTSITFTLLPTGNGHGHVSVSATYNAMVDEVVTKIGYYTAGLYDTETGALVYPSEISRIATTQAEDGKGSCNFPLDDKGNLVADDSLADINPGEYNLIYRFYEDKESTKVLGNYSERVIVIGGSISKKENLVISNFLSKPTAPSNLTAALAEAPDASTDTYKVKFTWKDNSSNEENFVITIKEYTTETENETTVLKEVTGGTYPLSYGPSWTEGFEAVAGGSVLANSKTATIELPTGHLFSASIKAQNAVGDSASSNLETINTKLEGSETEGSGLALSGVSTDINIFGRTRIIYSLNGGALKVTDDDDAITGEYCVEQNYSTTGIALLPLNSYTAGATNTAPYIYRTTDEKTTTKWVTGKNSTTLAESPYKGIADYTVYPWFETDAQINLYLYTEMDPKRITIKSGSKSISEMDTIAGETVTVTFDAKDASYSDNSPYTKKFSKFKVEYGLTTADPSSGWVSTGWTSVKYGTNGSSSSVDINFNEIYKDGTLAIMVIGYDSYSKAEYSQTFYYNLSR